MGKIVWLASYPKSGNTWLRFFLYAYMKLDPAKDDRIDLNDPGLKNFSTQDINREWFEPLLGKPAADASSRDVAAHRRAAHVAIAKAAPAAIMVKTHNIFAMDHGVHTITPEVTAGAIYIIRNPLDVLPSLKDHFGHRTMGRAMQQLNTRGWRTPPGQNRVSGLIGSWSQNVESWAGDRRAGVFPVRYEDMIAEPERIFGWILGVLGQDVDDERLKWALRLTALDRMKAAEAETGFGEKPEHATAFFRRGGAGGWREALSGGQVKQVVEANHAMMDRFGYLDDKLRRFIPKGAKPKA